MTVLTRLRRHTTMRRLGKTLEKRAKAWVYRRLATSWKPVPASSATLEGVKRVLLVRPNFRIGNALISARLIDAFAQARPDIEVDYLATDTTVSLFEGMPLTHCHALSRDMLVRPWKLFVLWRTLRQRRYELAIQVADTSLTGWLCLKAVGARRTLGANARLAGRYDEVYRVLSGQTHAYDMAATIAHSLGLDCESRPWMMISEPEQAQAQVQLEQLSHEPFDVGVFVGGHLNKRLPLAFWQALCDTLNARGIRFILLIGPEEASLQSALQHHVGRHGHIAPSMPLRTFAATLGQLPRLITPDTGPMHMAAALGVPVTAVLNVASSQKFVPRGHADQILLSPTPAEVVDAITQATFSSPLSSCVSGDVVSSCVSYW
ncbi:glycosyltransferase family 9 protein [Vreelandella rituensis]|uniref:Lipopolysaccharide heptosyltransferase family protein n=1 Tax=Vreelandella rituensis TaxID=2282306 RepID=A0A368TN93_9GAMM|nr:glycosyltransferase family 9 protein [Halomonas rituensis]RCV85722.1 lipopolysaccharide heptosyltransferase family protein [Halomonas rituensis]